MTASIVPTRNLAVDIFRGFALVIIFINHMPANPLSNYTPSRFGFSDSLDMLIFCSGLSAAYAYQKIFDRDGFLKGCIKIWRRCITLYFTHLGMFLVLLLLVFGLMDNIKSFSLLDVFDLGRALGQAPAALKEAVTLRYMPQYFDILPLYFVLLSLMPFVIWVAKYMGAGSALALSVLLYIVSWYFGWEMVANPTSMRHWHFNPFAWQLLFVFAFAIGARWVQPFAVTRNRVYLAAAVIVLAMPFRLEHVYTLSPYLLQGHNVLDWWADKSHCRPFRIVYFLAQAYLVGAMYQNYSTVFQHKIFDPLVLMGRHSLPVFAVGVFCAFLGNLILDIVSSSLLTVGLVSIGFGFLLWYTACIFQSIKSHTPLRAMDACPAAD